MEKFMKLPFQWVVIDPKRTPDEEVMVVLLRRYARSRDISERAALKDFTITLHTDLQNDSWCVGKKAWWSFTIYNFLSWYFSDHGRKSHHNSSTLEMMMIRSHDFVFGHASSPMAWTKKSPREIRQNWHGDIPFSSLLVLSVGLIVDAGPLTKVSTYH